MENEQQQTTSKASSITIEQSSIDKINKSISTILKEGAKITKAFDTANENLKKLNNDTKGLSDKKTKLLNILLKHSKKKLLFKFNNDGDNSRRNGEYEIGVNCAGLGVSGRYDNNLKNITDYYARDTFIELCKNPKFIKELLSHIKPANKKIVEKCLTSYGNEYKENKKLAENLYVDIGSRSIALSKDAGFTYSRDEIEPLSEENCIKEYENGDDTKYLKKITDKIFSVNHKQLVEFQFLINHKEVLLKYFTEKSKFFDDEYKTLNSKVLEIDKYLKPYEALEKI